MVMRAMKETQHGENIYMQHYDGEHKNAYGELCVALGLHSFCEDTLLPSVSKQ